MNYEFLPEADEEFREAACYYESEAPGVGLAFITEVHRVIFVVISHPRSAKIWLLLDEIQNVPMWEKWLNRLYEFEEIKIFVTGSNMSLMGSELSTALTGRNRQVVLWPFSFREFMAMKGTALEGIPHNREERAVAAWDV